MSPPPSPPEAGAPEDRPACVFDPIIAGEAPAHVVLDEPGVVGFLDARPVFRGHTLVVPRIHVGTVGELAAGALGALMEAGRRVAAAQRLALGNDGTFFALNDVVSQSVPHVHLHVVPRKRRDGLRGFLWPRTRYESDEDAAGVAAAIRAVLDGDTAGAVVTGEAGAAGAGPTLREARPADAAALAALLAGGTLRGGEDPADPAPYRAALEEIRSGRSGTVLVAEMAGAVVGMCQLIWFRHVQERGGLCAEIESVHVAEAHCGAGIGGLLVEAAVERAAALGCYRVQLTSNNSRVDAHRFYLRHGFEASHTGFKRYL